MENNQVFIKHIHIERLLHLSKIDIVLSETEKKHLIITGKNGSGKTSLLKELDHFLDRTSDSGGFQELEANFLRCQQYKKELNEFTFEKVRKEEYDSALKGLWNYADVFPTFNLSYLNLNKLKFEGKFLFVNFSVARSENTFLIPQTIEKVSIPTFTDSNSHIGEIFIKYLIFLRNNLTEASYNKDNVKVQKMEIWFENFEKLLQEIYEEPQLKLDYRNLNFYIQIPDRAAFDFNSMSDGYSAFIKIVVELLIRMERNSETHELPGLVLIDELETHLHVDLQRKVLPFLISFFPNIQFIVTTHSPFIINSIENAVVYDLENKMMINDASEYSYSAIIEGYLKSSEYSILMENKMKEFETLIKKNGTQTVDDKKRLAELDLDLGSLTPLSKEMFLRYKNVRKQIEKK